jgi:hypothetical protein
MSEASQRRGLSRGVLGCLPALALLPLLVRHDPPEPLRVLQVFAVPLAVLALASLLLWHLVLARREERAGAWRLDALRGALDGARGLVVIFVIVLAAVSFARAQLVSARPDDPRREHLLTGDEPSYLFIAHSLVFDGDLNLFNNREQGDQRHFYGRSLAAPGQFGFHFYNRISGGRLAGREAEWAGREYFINRPGLPLLIAPAYWTGFHAGLRIRFAVLVWLNVLAALLATVMFALARAVSGAPAASAGAALVLALSPPLLYYASQIYPELAAGLLLVGAVLGLVRTRSWGGALLTGLLVAYLPWLHERFLGVTVVLALAALVRAPTRRWFAALAIPVGLSLVLQAAYYWQLYGVPVPLSTATPLDFAAMPRGLLATLTDRDRGILTLNPLLLLAAFGLLPLWRRDRWLAGTVAAALIVYLVPIAAFRDWHGGVCPPLRYVASVTPLAVLPLVTLATEPGWPMTRASLWVLGAWGLWIAFVLASQPGLMFWKFGALFQPRSFHAAHALFPAYFHPGAGSVLRSALWLGFIALPPVLDLALPRLGRRLTLRSAALWLPLALGGGLVTVSLLSPLSR